MGFITSSWLSGYYGGNTLFKALIEEEKFKEYYARFVKYILKHPKVNITIACLKEDPDCILGYCVTREKTLDWIFVLPAWRKMGIAKTLLPKDIEICTHLTKVGKSLKPKNVRYEP